MFGILIACLPDARIRTGYTEMTALIDAECEKHTAT